jgi:hypothetical protein
MAKIRETKTASKSTTDSAPAPATPATTSEAPAVPAAIAAAPAPTQIAISPPVPGETVPTPPGGYTPADLAEYRGLLPKGSQLTALPDVIKELRRFTDYAEVFGKTAPPLPWVLQTFDAANQWSQMHVKNQTWDEYTRTQEAMAWKDVHFAMQRMQPALELAVKGDATVGTQNPALVRFFGAASVIAQKAVSTKKANQKKTENGELPTSGKVGKQRQKAAAKAALAEKNAAAQTAGNAVVSSTTPVATPPAATNGVAGSANGAAHS